MEREYTRTWSLTKEKFNLEFEKDSRYFLQVLKTNGLQFRMRMYVHNSLLLRRSLIIKIGLLVKLIARVVSYRAKRSLKE